jgi:pimeloyl-ACP methyl ester carboxylesterase
MPPEIMRSFTLPMRQNPRVRRDIRRMLRAVDTRYTFDAAARLSTFERPALVLWAENDRIFPRRHGKRLAELLPQGEFEIVADCRTFIPEEQPESLATRLRQWLEQTAADGG